MIVLSPNSVIWSLSVGTTDVPVLVKNLLILFGIIDVSLFLKETFLLWVWSVPPEIAIWHSSPSHNEPSEINISLNFFVDEPISYVSVDSGIILPLVWINPAIPFEPPVPFSPDNILILPPLVLVPLVTEPPFCPSILILYPFVLAFAVPAIISNPEALILSFTCNW